MNIAITGASGFVGTNLKRYLSSLHDVQPFIVRYIPNQQFNLKADAVIHLAGKAHDLKKVANPQEYYEANFELTKQLYDQFLQSDADKLIYISSVKAATDTVVGVLTEEADSHPITAYGKSKLMAENYIKAFILIR